MIYDCFPFFNELDVIEIRLNELNSVVDKFVLVESTRTFQKQPKPLYYQKNKERLKDFEDKIMRIVVDKSPNFFSKWRIPTAWDYDHHQKDQVIWALKNCNADNVIIISDLDEIPSGDKVLEYKNRPGIKVFEQLQCNYYLNCVAVESPSKVHLNTINGQVYWRGSVMLNFSDFTTFKKVRRMRDKTQNEEIFSIKKSGWHFSFVGNYEKIRQKLDSRAHTNEKEYNPEYIFSNDVVKSIIKEGKDLFGRNYKYKIVPLPEYFPRYLINNKDKYNEIIG